MPRSPFVRPEHVRIELTEGRWIEVKKRLSVGEARQAMTSFVGAYRSDGSRTPNLETLGMGQVLAYLIEWNFVDDTDRVVPVSLDAIKMLDPRVYGEVETAINAHVAAVEADDAEREKKIPAPSTPSVSPTS